MENESRKIMKAAYSKYGKKRMTSLRESLGSKFGYLYRFDLLSNINSYRKEHMRYLKYKRQIKLRPVDYNYLVIELLEKPFKFVPLYMGDTSDVLRYIAAWRLKEGK
jgi:hypothetical protein